MVKLLLIATALVLLTQGIQSLECYSCVGCDDPFSHFIAGVSKCKINDTYAPICKVIVFLEIFFKSLNIRLLTPKILILKKVTSSSTTERSCSYRESCKEGTLNGITTSCCETDLCNDSQIVIASKIIYFVFASTAILAIIKLFH